MRCDLHLHSNLSDGEKTPEEVVAEARLAGLELIALTDHDTTAGVPRALAEARRISGGPRLIWGVEITTSLVDRELHILGYFPERPSEQLERFLESARVQRNERVLEGLGRLRELTGIVLDDAEVWAVASGPVLSRSHVATAMVRRGIVADRKSAFATRLGGANTCFPSTPLHPQLAIAAIHEAGGLAFWAHPEFEAFEETVLQLAADGLDGLETTCRSKGHSQFLESARLRLGLLASGGSDWHGRGLPPSRGRWHVPSSRIRELIDRLGIDLNSKN